MRVSPFSARAKVYRALFKNLTEAIIRDKQIPAAKAFVGFCGERCSVGSLYRVGAVDEADASVHPVRESRE